MTIGLLVAGFLGAASPGRAAVAFGERRPSPRTLLLVLAGGAAVVLAGALAADRLLDGLDVSRESFRIAAGIVLVLGGVLDLLRPRVGGPPGAVLVVPDLACMAVVAGSGAALARALGAAAIALAAVALVAAPPRPAALARLLPFLAALEIVVGVALVIAGVRDV